jgi:hypothetical protein
VDSERATYVLGFDGSRPSQSAALAGSILRNGDEDDEVEEVEEVNEVNGTVSYAWLSCTQGIWPKRARNLARQDNT